MIQTIRKCVISFISFSLRITVLSFIFAHVCLKIRILVSFIKDKWTWRGIDKNQYYIDGVEKYYMEYGKQCRNCRCWIPLETAVCPVCEGISHNKRVIR
jgi:hypothetical protein